MQSIEFSRKQCSVALHQQNSMMMNSMRNNTNTNMMARSSWNTHTNPNSGNMMMMNSMRVGAMGMGLNN